MDLVKPSLRLASEEATAQVSPGMSMDVKLTSRLGTPSSSVRLVHDREPIRGTAALRQYEKDVEILPPSKDLCAHLSSSCAVSWTDYCFVFIAKCEALGRIFARA